MSLVFRFLKEPSVSLKIPATSEVSCKLSSEFIRSLSQAKDKWKERNKDRLNLEVELSPCG